MKKCGFTLIELLVVIILIAAIVLLALPKITNSVKNNSTNVDKITFNLIKEATKLYVSDNENSFIKRSENTYCVSLNELIEENYLKNTIQYNNQDITNTKVMKVTYENGFNYELVDKKDCKILPDEYQQVEYIEITGTQYIDTNFTPTGKLTVEGKISVPKPNSETAVMGTVSYGWELGFSSTIENRMFSYIHALSSVAVETTTSMWDTKLKFTAINDLENSFRSLSLDLDNSYTSDTNILSDYRQNLLLFSYRNSFIFVGKCYYIKIYDNDILMRNYVPCYRKSDGEIGMYDLVNNVFYTNAGTGAFIKGKNI